MSRCDWSGPSAAVAPPITEDGGDRFNVMSHRADMGVEGTRCAGVAGVDGMLESPSKGIACNVVPFG